MKINLNEVAAKQLIELQPALGNVAITHIANLAIAAFYKLHINSLPTKEEPKNETTKSTSS
jgi:hypothetical protein